MNKFLMLAIAAITLGLAVPAMAEEAVTETTTAVEVTTEAAPEACMNEEGVEIECPAVEVEAGAEAEAHDDAAEHATH